jgi:hypothetical protein
MAGIARYNRDQARLRDLGYAVDGHFELTLDDLVDFFLRMEVLVNGRAAAYPWSRLTWDWATPNMWTQSPCSVHDRSDNFSLPHC